MLKRHFVIGMVTVSAIVIAPDTVLGQAYPNKPIRFLTSAAGGSNDIMARMIGQAIAGPLGQPMVVDNRATSLLAAEVSSKAPPDGYNVLFAAATLWITPLMQNTSYDAIRDFAPLTLVASSPLIVAVHPSLPVKSVKELIALAKARPGELNYGSAGNGSSSHLSAELFKSMAGVNIVRIPYKGNAQSLTDLMGGQVQLAIPPAASVTPHLKSGRLKALAATSAQPSALAPGLPTVAASGLPGYEMLSTDTVMIPAKTPEAIISRLNQEMVRYLKTAEAKEKLFNMGAEVVASSPEELGAVIRADVTRMGKVIKEAGIRSD